MMNPRRRTEASERFAERRRREEAAPRLHDRVPDLVSLKLTVEEAHDPTGAVGSKHIRHIVVDRAPALFVIPCGDPSCTQGGFDITDSIMHGLLAHEPTFEATDRCLGTIGSANCQRTLLVKATAAYNPRS